MNTSKLVIVVAHTFYVHPGGEDRVFRSEVELLRKGGHVVVPYTLSNDHLTAMSSVAALRATLWNQRAYESLTAVLRDCRPDVVHFHNTFPLMSPAVYYAARKAGAVVIQSLHNYRLLCPSATLFRDGNVCERCVGKTVPWPSVVHGCYRNSRRATTAVAAMTGLHRALRTWSDRVDMYIALSEFGRAKALRSGLSPAKVRVKPNFVDPDPGCGSGSGDFVLFAGRLSAEKGIDVLLSAWRGVPRHIVLKIVGDGPLRADVEAAARRSPNIHFLGWQPHEALMRLIKEAYLLVLPSVCYEGFPVVIAECFAVGVPVICSDGGSAASLIDPGKTGVLFRRRDAVDLTEKVAWCYANRSAVESMRSEARGVYEAKYSGDRNYEQLMGIYDEALRKRAVPGNGYERSRGKRLTSSAGSGRGYPGRKTHL